MSRRIALAFAALAVCLAQDRRVTIETDQGRIVVELDGKRAPRTVHNFLHYVDAGHYSGGLFHRTVRTKPDNQPQNDVKIDVIQAGVRQEARSESRAPIELERTSVTGVPHKDGTISMARFGPDSAISEFFICVGDQPELDFGGRRNPDGQGFAAFGQVVEGMDVVRKIHASPANAQRLTPGIRILSINRHPDARK